MIKNQHFIKQSILDLMLDLQHDILVLNRQNLDENGQIDQAVLVMVYLSQQVGCNDDVEMMYDDVILMIMAVDRMDPMLNSNNLNHDDSVDN